MSYYSKKSPSRNNNTKKEERSSSGRAKGLNEDNYVDVAEEVIEILKEKLPSTSQIRKVLAMCNDIYNDVMTASGEQLDETMIQRLQYMRVQLIYAAGREQKVKSFIEEADLIELLRSVGNSKKRFLLFNRYMEALVAFHKYYGGSDK